MADKFIDLGQKYDSSPCCSTEKKDEKETRISYPSLYISGVKVPFDDLTMGEVEFSAKGKVTSISHREDEKNGDKWSVEIEVHSISFPGANEEDDSTTGLNKAISKAASKKQVIDDPEDVVDGGADEDTEA